MESNAPIVQSFKIDYSYKLHFTQNLFGIDNPLFVDILTAFKPSGQVKILVAIDDGVARAHPKLSRKLTEYAQKHSQKIDLRKTLVLPGGEQSKNDSRYVTEITEAISDYGICRHSFVIAIGGGALIDMAGYAAATAHRGVKLIRIPTTVLSQNDAAVGVKNGINSFNKKNFLGTFAPPYAVINDSEFLKTLEQRDWIAGIAEGVKVALIKDKNFFGYIEQYAQALNQRAMGPMHHLIHRCAELHMQHIAQGGDPFESGSSRPLDFGHWAAHKLEQMTGNDLRHGEAVAVGMALDLTYAQRVGLISETTLHRILKVLKTIGFVLHVPVQNKSEINELLLGIEEFREHLGGELTITLILDIGTKQDVHTIEMDTMREAIDQLNALANQGIPG